MLKGKAYLYSRMPCRLLIAASIVFIQLHCIGQTHHPLSPDRPLKDLSIAQWTADDGLASNNITSVFQSADGLLWVTSFNGFMHFDGVRTELFDRSNLGVMDTDGFYISIQDSKGTVWLGSQGSGIIRYDSGIYKKFLPVPGSVPLSIRTLCKARNEDILVGSSNAGLYRIHGNVLTQIHHPDLDKITVMSIVDDGNGTIWAATDGEGVFSVNGDEVRRYTTADGLLSNSVAALKIWNDGRILLGTNRGLQVFRDQKFSVIPAFSGIQINALWVDSWNSVWVGTERGIARFNEKFKTEEWLLSKNNIDFVRISHITQDAEGNIWVASNRSGIIRVKETNISNITRPNLSSDRTNIVHEGPDGKFYIGTDVNQIDVCESGSCRPLVIHTSAAGNGIRDIYAEQDGTLWVATYSGIIRRDKNGKETPFTEKQGMPAEDFRVIHKAKNGIFWFGSRSGGVVKFHNDKIVKIYDHENGLQSNYIFSITEDKEGNIYIGTHSGGMTVIATDGSLKTYHVRDDDAGILLFNIDIDEAGRVWAMANTGPLYFDGQSLKPIKLQADGKSKTYFDWIDDRQGNMWITTSIGVLQLKKSDVLEFIAGTRDKVPDQLLDDSDGMNNKECTGATRSMVASDNRLYIPTLGGICEINALQKKEVDKIPAVQIAHFLTDNKDQFLFGGPLDIQAGTLRYTFQFRVHSYSALERNKYRYMLENFDEEWSEPTLLGEVEYTNLPPGTYTFRVSGSNGYNVWNEKGVSLTFRVLPFFYQTIWFFILLAAMAVLILYALYQWRVSFIRRQNLALKKVNAELDRFVYSASHDLRSPLSSILGLISVARSDKANLEMYMGLMEKSVKKLDSFIRDIIEFSRNARLEVHPEVVDFEKLINDVLEDLHFMDNFEKITKTVTVSINSPFATDAKRLRVVLSNIIANAIKHHWMNQGTPTLDIHVTQNHNRSVTIDVIDNGPGIPAEHLDDIFKMFFRASDRTSGSGLGLYIVKETVHRLNGEVTVSSQMNKGTTFRVVLPFMGKSE